MDLNDIRREIDCADSEIAQALVKRLTISDAVAAHKLANAMPVLDAQREREVINRAAAMVKDEFAPYIKAVYGAILPVCRARQSSANGGYGPLSGRLRDAISNPPPVFPSGASVACVDNAACAAACERLFPRPCITPVGTTEDVFAAISHGESPFGILPCGTGDSSVDIYEKVCAHDCSIIRAVAGKSAERWLCVVKGPAVCSDARVISLSLAFDDGQSGLAGALACASAFGLEVIRAQYRNEGSRCRAAVDIAASPWAQEAHCLIRCLSDCGLSASLPGCYAEI